MKDLSVHVEMNAGVNFGNINWLFGANYLFHSADYSKTRHGSWHQTSRGKGTKRILKA